VPYLSGLARKRQAAGVLFRAADNRVLLADSIAVALEAVREGGTVLCEYGVRVG
jgi:hypothetical protein